MVLQLPWIELVLVIVCINCVLVPYASCKFVKCKLGVTTEGKCTCQELSQNETPWSKKDAETAPTPRNASIKMKHVDGGLIPKIKWTLDKQYVDHANGFYLEFWLRPNHYEYYSCAYNSSTILKTFGKASMAGFEFTSCCRTLSSVFRDGDEINVHVFSMPMYGDDENPYSACAELTVGSTSTVDTMCQGLKNSDNEDPESEEPVNPSNYPKSRGGLNKKIQDINNRMTRIEDLLLDRDSSKDSTSNMVNTVIIAVVTIIVCLCLVFLVAYFIRRKYPSTQSMRRNHRILLVSDENEYGIKLANGFVEILKKSSNREVTVISNVRRTSEIATAGIVPWITENISNCSVVVMLINNSELIKSAFATQDDRKDVDLKKSPVSVALNVADSAAMKSNFRISKKKFILVHTDAHETKRLPFCTHYILRKHFKEMLKFVLGHRYDSSVDVKEDYNHVLDVIEKNVGEGVEKRPDVRRKTTKLGTNNLDVSFIPDQNEPRSDVNDFSLPSRNRTSEYTSVENNEVV